MIIATFKIATVEEKRCYLGYSLEGHANFAPMGKDIVCAAVSSIYIGVSNKLITDFGAIDDSKEKLNKIINIVMCLETTLLISVLEETLKEIAEQYPDNVKVVVYNGQEEV